MPRLIALVITLPLLTFFADIMGLLGGGGDFAIRCSTSRRCSTWTACTHAVDGSDLFVGLFKAPIFAFFIGDHRLHARTAGERLGGERRPRDHPRGGQVDLSGDRARCTCSPSCSRSSAYDDACSAQRRTDPFRARHRQPLRQAGGARSASTSTSSRGEIIGIAGGSGSGKSVLLKTLTGLHRPDAGEVLIGRQAGRSDSARRRRLRSSACCSSRARCFRRCRWRRTSCCRCASTPRCRPRTRSGSRR